ncbi:asparaginase [Mesobacillus foraminis]|uniref:asparaginase n=1 Tax=Mesobacillus foraminis TaxID=279826 RepID=UPI001BE7D6C1|nr:asparaginase [Mesobacillus foraminis]MBT2757430.1 asparaginase [Mesobacillus foraminis]
MIGRKVKQTLSVMTASTLLLAGATAVVTEVNPKKVTYAAANEASAKQGADLPKVQVIGTGGTISGKSTDETSFISYRSGSLAIKDMVDELPNVEKMADVSTTQFGNKGSSAYSMQDLYDLSLLVDEQLKKNDGVVVTTGTDTMEEIAYFLDLTVQSNKPVVVTGSMRPWTVIGSDAQANLFNAIKLAGSGETSSFGTVIMLNDTMFPARDVTKTNSYRVDTFESRTGPLGHIDENNIQVYEAPARAFEKGENWRTPFNLKKLNKADLAKVEIAYSYQGAGGEAIKAFAEAGADGIVTAGTGAGGISSAQSAERKAAIEKGVVFMSATRTGSGSVYGGGAGIIPADSLNAQHARILLMLSLSFSDDFDQVKEWVTKYGAREVDVK